MKGIDSLPSLENESIRKVLFTALALIFTLPLLVFVVAIDYYQLLSQRLIQVSIALSLLFSLLGLMLLRQLVDSIIAFSHKARQMVRESTGEDVSPGHNEMKVLADTFQKLAQKFDENTANLSKRISELSALQKLTYTVLKVSGLDELFEVVLEHIIETSDSQFGVIYAVHGEGDTVTVKAVRGKDTAMLEGKEISASSTIIGRVLRENKVLILSEPSTEPDFNKNFDYLFESWPLFAKAIRARGKTIAVLALSKGKSREPFRETEIDFISTAISHISFAFDNAQLISELRNSYDELKAMQQKLVKLERVAAIHQTVVTLNDKINSPLTVIQGHAELIRKLLGSCDEKLCHSLNQIEESVSQCTEIMSKLKHINEPVIKMYTDMNTSMIDIDNSAVEGHDTEPLP